MHRNCYLHHDVAKQSYIPQIWLGSSSYHHTYVLLATRVAFFGLILCNDPFTTLLGKFGVTPLLATVYIGALQNIFSKSSKYILFDPCKEMAYIPLDEDTKLYFLCILSQVFRASVYSIFTFIFVF